MRRRYKAVLFDLGYTLIRTDRETALQDSLRQVGVDLPIADIDRAFHVADKYFMREKPGLLAQDPSLFMDEYQQKLAQVLGISLKEKGNPLGLESHRDDPGHMSRGTWFVIDGADAAIHSLMSVGIKVGIVSNWDLSAREVLASCGLLPVLDTIVISSELGVAKPHPAIFQAALDALSVSAGESLYVGDNYYDDIVGARGVGMDGALINRFGTMGIEEIQGCPVFESVSQLVNQLLLLRS